MFLPLRVNSSTGRSYRKNYWILSDPMGIRRRLSDSGKYRYVWIPIRSRNAVTFSDIRQLIEIQYQGFRRTSIRSDRVRLTLSILLIVLELCSIFFIESFSFDIYSRFDFVYFKSLSFRVSENFSNKHMDSRGTSR